MRLLSNLYQDVSHSIRALRRSKGVALGVLISLGLGIGMTASVFSFVDYFALRPLPVPETNRVVRIVNAAPTDPAGGFSYPEYRDYVERSQSFDGIVTYGSLMVGFAPNRTDQPRVANCAIVSGNFFSVLHITPTIGRAFLPEEDSAAGKNSVAVISYSEWQRDFAGARDVIGRAVRLNGHEFTIIGVAPEQFRGMEPVIEQEVYVPHTFVGEPFSGIEASLLTNRAIRSVVLIGRLRRGVTVGQATTEMALIAGDLAVEHPETNKDRKAVVLTQAAYRQTVGPASRGGPILLFILVVLVLGIACVNVSNLLLSTVPARAHEIAVRVAMGAPRMRLVRQFLCESIILSSAGTLIGLAIASWCASYISSIRIGSDLPLRFSVQVDERVVIFAAAVGLLAAFLSGAIPAWRCSRGDLHSLLKAADLRTQTQRTRGRQILSAVQVAATTFILIFSALQLKEFELAAVQYPGFRVDHVLTMAFNPSVAGYDREKTFGFYRRLLESVRPMQGVRSAAIAQDKPFGVINSGSTNLKIAGYEAPANQPALNVRSAFVTDSYFDTLNIPIIRGRAFDRRDDANGARTVIINEVMAERYWPNRDPIGSRVMIEGTGGGSAEVIGIARNSKYGSLSEPATPFLYRSYYQGDETVAVLFVQTDRAAEVMISAIRDQVRQMDSNMPIFDVRRLQEHVNDAGLLEPRLAAEIFTTIASVGLILAVLGLYGVIAYSVGQRTHEIGIRMAVGASNRQVLRSILMQGMTWSGIAASAGVGLALLLSMVVKNTLSNVSPRDPAVYASVLLLILTVTGLACYIPARRASLVDPNITLRS